MVYTNPGGSTNLELSTIATHPSSPGHSAWARLAWAPDVDIMCPSSFCATHFLYSYLYSRITRVASTHPNVLPLIGPPVGLYTN